MQLNTWLPFFIQTPVFCEIFFKNISLSRPWGLLCNFSSCWTWSNDCKQVLPLQLFSRLAITRDSQGIGRSGHYNQSENSFFSSAFSLNVRNFPDVIPCCLEKRKCCSSNNIPNQKKIWQNVRWYRIWVLRCGRPGFRWKNRVGRNMGTLFSPLSLLWYSVQLIFNP